MDSGDWRAVPRRHRRARTADVAAVGNCRAHVDGRVVADPGGRVTLLLSHTFSSDGPVRNVLSLEFFPLVHLLGTEPDPSVFLDSFMGWPATRRGGNSVLRLHDGWRRRVASGVSGHLSMHRQVRFHRPFRTGAKWTTHPCTRWQNRLA